MSTKFRKTSGSSLGSKPNEMVGAFPKNRVTATETDLLLIVFMIMLLIRL